MSDYKGGGREEDSLPTAGARLSAPLVGLPGRRFYVRGKRIFFPTSSSASDFVFLDRGVRFNFGFDLQLGLAINPIASFILWAWGA